MTDRILFIIIFILITYSFSYRQYAVNRRDAFLLRAGLACTLAADFCMLILYKNTIGLMFFICVQTIYFFRHLSARLAGHGLQRPISRRGMGVSKLYASAAVFIPALIGIFIVLSRFTPLNPETQLAVIYACALTASVLSAFIYRKSYPYPNSALIPLGMLLFM